MMNFSDIERAHKRIKNHIKRTPIICNKILNEEIGAEIFLKMESQQETLSFKARGAFNAVLAYQEKHGKLPEKIVIQSSGNHAQAVAMIGKKLNIPVLIYMAAVASPFKVQKAREFGAEVILCEKRVEANIRAEEKEAEGYFFIHPSANDDVIAGQGTAALEALEEIGNVDAIFAPCGGGGLISGCYLASLNLNPRPKVFACEPLNANDAAISVRAGEIFSFEDSPTTVADGARTLAVKEPCFTYLKKLDGILEIMEEEIIFWQKRLSEILQQKIESTSALAVAGAKQFMEKRGQTPFSKSHQKFLVIISGGNV